MHLPEPARLIAALAAADRRLVVISTGGGSLAIPHLVTTPGASRVILDAQVPYSCAAVDLLLGGPQEAYAAPKTARRLAAAQLGVSPWLRLGRHRTARSERVHCRAVGPSMWSLAASAPPNLQSLKYAVSHYRTGAISGMIRASQAPPMLRDGRERPAQACLMRDTCAHNKYCPQ